jgi:hypothetical protein
MGGQSYALYTASNVARATVVGAQLSGLGSAGAIAPTQLALISLGVLAFVLGAGVILFGHRMRPAAPPPTSADTQHERLELVVRLAALDERFAAGEIARDAYETERDAGKQRLRELTLALRQQPSTTAV